MAQLISEFSATNFVPQMATRAEAAVQSAPAGNTEFRLLLTGFKLAAGTQTVNTIVGPIASEAEAATLAGAGSELVRMYRAGRRQSKLFDQMYFGCVEEPSGTPAYAKATISGTWSTPGELIFIVDGFEEPLIVSVGANDAAADVAAAVETEQERYPSLSYICDVTSGEITFTKNNKGTRGNTAILYCDTRNAPSGLVVSLEPPEGAIVTLVNELRTDLIAHFALIAGSVHGAADTTSGVGIGAACTNLVTAIVLVNQLRAAYELHRVLTAGSVHGAADSTNVISTAAATTAAGVVTLANEIKTDYNAHRVLTAGSVHGGSGDTTNVVTSANATAGTVTGNQEIGDGVQFASGTGTEDVADLIAAIEADPKWFKRVVVSSLDTTNLGKWEVHADDMNAPLVQRPAAYILAHHGVEAVATAISKTQINHEAFEVLWGEDALQPACEIAAKHGVQRCLVERNEPEGWNQSYSGTILEGVTLALDPAKRPTKNGSQVTALRNGLTPLVTTSDGECQIVRAIWTRCQNSDGSPNYLGLDVAEWTVLQELREATELFGNFFRLQNPKVRDNFAIGEPVISGVATPKGWEVGWMGEFSRRLQDAKVFLEDPSIQATFNKTTKRLQSLIEFARMPLNEQAEAVVRSLG